MGSYVSLELRSIDSRSYDICKDGAVVGSICINGAGEVSFEILEPFRRRHYATSSLFDFTRLAHGELHEPIIHAIVPISNEIARHVVEHNGYSIVALDKENLYYEHRLEETRKDDSYRPQSPLVALYFAGGCFWGMERAFQLLDGVVHTVVGYANGNMENPTYEQVCRMETGFKECVRVTFDPNVTSLETLMKAFFICINPEQGDGQGNDIGSQYETGVYFRSDSVDSDTILRLQAIFEEERQSHGRFYTELGPLHCFYEAEEYHQDYLLKHPSGYCHITRIEMNAVKALNGGS